MASHPADVHDAVDDFREALDRHPEREMVDHGAEREAMLREAAASYSGVPSDNIAFVPSTSIGLSLLYAGVRLKRGQEILSTDHEFSGVWDALHWREQREQRARCSTMPVRRIFDFPNDQRIEHVDVPGIVAANITPATRVLALTWVYSNSGVKLPIAAIARVVADINRDRSPEDRVLFCVDGVHGFGVESAQFGDLGCDFLVSGCHKWILGPRGTGVWLGTAPAWKEVDLVAISLRHDDTFPPGVRFSPNGVQAYEHRWALAAAFRFLESVGRYRIESQIHSLASRLKQGLARLGLQLITPLSDDWSAGIVCVDVGKNPKAIVDRLWAERGIVATTSSSDRSLGEQRFLRFSVALFHVDDDIDHCVDAVAGILRSAAR